MTENNVREEGCKEISMAETVKRWYSQRIIDINAVAGV